MPKAWGAAALCWLPFSSTAFATNDDLLRLVVGLDHESLRPDGNVSGLGDESVVA